MTLNESYITLRNVRFHAFHGVLAQERTVGNDYTVCVRVKVDVGRAMQSDCVDDTVNYAEIYRVVAEEMAVPSALLEHVAGRIAQRIFRQFPSVEAADITLRKHNPPFGADCQGAEVELHCTNEKTE